MNLVKNYRWAWFDLDTLTIVMFLFVFPFLLCLGRVLRSCGGEDSALPRQDSQEYVTVEVDGLRGQDCKGQTLEQNLTCNSIMDMLNVITEDSSNTSVEVIINSGSYVVEGTFIVARDVSIRGQEGQSVEIHLQTQGSTPPVFMYSLSFRNTGYVSIQNISFTGSNGILGFDNVSRVEISSSSFRYVK